MKLFKGPSLVLSIFFLYGMFTILSAQSSVTFKIDGSDFTGSVQEAVLVNIGGENFIQIKAVKKEQFIFLYLKEKDLKGEFPVTLKYKAHDHEKKQTPDAEAVWAPAGGDQPAWNTLEGEAVITQYSNASKTISGTFEFVVEKQNTGTKKDVKMDRAEIEEGKITNVTFTIDASAAGK